jgi:hypothetical protein
VRTVAMANMAAIKTVVFFILKEVRKYTYI